MLFAMKSINRWKIAGIISIVVLGFLFHYLFSWSDSSKLIGFFAPVNESVWEHLKLGYWSLVLFSIVEYLNLRKSIHNYYLAKLIGVVVLELTIIIIYYCYTFILNKNLFLIDIFSYIMGVVFCQYTIYWLIRLKPFPKAVNKVSLILFVLIGLMFGITTFYPPRIGLFKDFNSNEYGIKISQIKLS